MVKFNFLASVPRNLSTRKFQKILVNFYCLEIMESERRLAVDKGFNAAIQEILQVVDVIFTWRLRGVLNDTIRKYFVYFSWD